MFRDEGAKLVTTGEENHVARTVTHQDSTQSSVVLFDAVLSEGAEGVRCVLELVLVVGIQHQSLDSFKRC